MQTVLGVILVSRSHLAARLYLLVLSGMLVVLRLTAKLSESGGVSLHHLALRPRLSSIERGSGNLGDVCGMLLAGCGCFSNGEKVACLKVYDDGILQTGSIRGIASLSGRMETGQLLSRRLTIICSLKSG